jgi:tetratricopeptide (TPR) repeat protein
VRDSPIETGKSAEPANWWRWLAVAAAVVLLGLSIRLLPGEIFAEKARVALRDDRNADARDFARQGLAWDKRNPVLYGYLGEAEHFLTLDAPDPMSARILHEDALASYEAALKIFPRDTALLLKKAQVLDLLNRFSEAEDVFQQLFKFDPLFGNVYAYYGLHWKLQNRLKSAELSFRVAKRLGETEISTTGLQNIEQLRANPLAQALISNTQESPLDLPAAWLLDVP